MGVNEENNHLYSPSMYEYSWHFSVFPHLCSMPLKQKYINCCPSSKSMPSIISSLDIKSPTGFSSWTACRNHLDGSRHAGTLSWWLVNSWLSNQGTAWHGVRVYMSLVLAEEDSISSPGIEVFQFLPPICSFSQAASSASQLSLQGVEKPAPQASLWIFLLSTSVACNVCHWEVQSLKQFLMRWSWLSCVVGLEKGPLE